jgi:hypothetical protein
VRTSLGLAVVRVEISALQCLEFDPSPLYLVISFFLALNPAPPPSWFARTRACQRSGPAVGPGSGAVSDKIFSFRNMTRQDYFCLYDAIHTLVRQDEISKEQVPLLYASFDVCCRFHILMRSPVPLCYARVENIGVRMRITMKRRLAAPVDLQTGSAYLHSGAQALANSWAMHPLVCVDIGWDC